MTGLPSSWVFARLGDIADWGSGGTPKSGTAEYYGGKIPWVVTGDLTDGPVRASTQTITELGLAKSSAKLVPPGTVLVAMYGASIGRAGIAGMPLTTNQAISHAQVYSQVALPEYVLYFLLGQRRALAAAGKGAAQPNIGQGVLKEWPIPIAPLPEQQRMVAAIEEQFSRLDAGVAALGRAQQNLKRMRSAVLQAAITGALTSGMFNQPPVEHLLKQILEARRDASRGAARRYVEPASPSDSALPIPSHWTFASLDMLAGSSESIVDGPFGSNLKTSHYTLSGPRVIRLQNVRGDGQFIDIKAHISESHYEMLVKHSVNPGDLVCVLLGEIMPKAVIIPDVIGPAIVKADCPRVRLSPLVNHRFVWAALNAPGVQQEVSRRIHGVGRPRLTLRELRQVAIPLPPRQEQDAIVEVMDRQLETIARVSDELGRGKHKSQHLRSAILSAAFSGKLVNQDPADEPVAKLLEGIVAEKASSKARSKRGQKPQALRKEFTA